MPALFDHDFGGNREGVLGACPFEVLHIISFSLDYWSIYWCLCSTIALSHVIFRICWTSRAHLMYPVLSYQVSPDHVHLPMNMTALMVGILRVEERGNEHASQAIAIDSRSKLQQFSDWLKTCPSARENRTASWDVFFRVSFEKAACIVNGFLERQSDRSIPCLSYQAGLTAVTKMQGQDFLFQGYAFLRYFPWEEWWDLNMWSWRETSHFCYGLVFPWMTVCLRRCTLPTVCQFSVSALFSFLLWLKL